MKLRKEICIRRKFKSAIKSILLRHLDAMIYREDLLSFRIDNLREIS